MHVWFSQWNESLLWDNLLLPLVSYGSPLQVLTSSLVHPFILWSDRPVRMIHWALLWNGREILTLELRETQQKTHSLLQRVSGSATPLQVSLKPTIDFNVMKDFREVQNSMPLAHCKLHDESLDYLMWAQKMTHQYHHKTIYFKTPTILSQVLELYNTVGCWFDILSLPFYSFFCLSSQSLELSLSVYTKLEFIWQDNWIS